MDNFDLKKYLAEGKLLNEDLIPSKGGEVKFRGELRWDRLKDGTFSRFISGGTYIVGDIIDGEVELFSKSRKRFEKAGTRHLVPIEVLKKRLSK